MRGRDREPGGTVTRETGAATVNVQPAGISALSLTHRLLVKPVALLSRICNPALPCASSFETCEGRGL